MSVACVCVCLCGRAESGERGREKKTPADNRPDTDRSLKTQKTENQPHYFYLPPFLSASLSHVRRFPGILRDLWSPGTRFNTLPRPCPSTLPLAPPLYRSSSILSSFISFRGSLQPFGPGELSETGGYLLVPRLFPTPAARPSKPDGGRESTNSVD